MTFPPIVTTLTIYVVRLDFDLLYVLGLNFDRVRVHPVVTRAGSVGLDLSCELGHRSFVQFHIIALFASSRAGQSSSARVKRVLGLSGTSICSLILTVDRCRPMQDYDCEQNCLIISN